MSSGSLRRWGMGCHSWENCVTGTVVSLKTIKVWVMASEKHVNAVVINLLLWLMSVYMAGNYWGKTFWCIIKSYWTENFSTIEWLYTEYTWLMRKKFQTQDLCTHMVTNGPYSSLTQTSNVKMAKRLILLTRNGNYPDRNAGDLGGASKSLRAHCQLVGVANKSAMERWWATSWHLLSVHD